MEYLIVLGVVFIGSIVMGAALLVILERAMVESEDLVDRADDEYGLQSVRDELAMWESAK